LKAASNSIMTPEGKAILDTLFIVSAERRRRAADAGLFERVVAVKSYQHRRFSLTYTDLLANARFGPAARFFLEDLYGPNDFTDRDEQFVRVVPGLIRLFPRELVLTVLALGDLHALSETLDTRMAMGLCDRHLDPMSYHRAWKLSATPDERERQIALMLRVGLALDRYTRNVLLRNSLRLMRGPARAAGLGSLQSFLESGFDTFKSMRGATEFLDTVTYRERRLAALLFATEPGDATLSDQLPPAR
jgi:hypothetical protein